MADKTTFIDFISPTRAQLSGAFDGKLVSNALAYRPPGYKYVRAFKMRVWDGYTRLFDSTGYTFPAGLAWRVKRVLEDAGYSVTLRQPPLPDNVVIKHTNDIKLGGVTLYPWQKFAIRAALNARRGILKVATGGGKTEITAGLIAGLRVKRHGRTLPPKALIVVPNRNLLTQTRARLAERLKVRPDEIGNIGYGKWQEDWVTVAIPGTLLQPKRGRQLTELLKVTDLLIFDECHHTPSESWSTIAKRCRAPWRVGLSGTPLDQHDGSNLLLEGMTGPLLVDITSKSLVAQGKLAKPTIRFVQVRQPLLPDDLPWEDVYTMGVTKNAIVNRAVVREAEAALANGRSVLVLVTRISHGQELVRMFRAKSNRKLTLAQGGMDEDKLSHLITRYRAGKDKLLVATPVFGEGTDLPNIDVLIIADGGKSAVKTIQKVGRALRQKKGKPNEALIVDFAFYTHKFLGRHSLRRWQLYEREQFDVEKRPTDLMQFDQQ